MRPLGPDAHACRGGRTSSLSYSASILSRAVPARPSQGKRERSMAVARCRRRPRLQPVCRKQRRGHRDWLHQGARLRGGPTPYGSAWSAPQFTRIYPSLTSCFATQLVRRQSKGADAFKIYRFERVPCLHEVSCREIFACATCGLLVGATRYSCSLGGSLWWRIQRRVWRLSLVLRLVLPLRDATAFSGLSVRVIASVRI
jgi:hypothetical protein